MLAAGMIPARLSTRLAAGFAAMMVAAAGAITAAQGRDSVDTPVSQGPRMPALPPAEIDNTLIIGGESIDAKKARTRLTVAVQVNGQGPYRFLVDSGADTSVVGQRIAASLRLPSGTRTMLNGITESRRVDRVLVDELRLGRTAVSGLQLPVLEEGDIGAEGMIGLDALVEQRLMLDFEKKIITVDDGRGRAPRLDGEIVVTARTRRGQLILTQVSASGKQVEAVIDTGTEVTIGNEALRRKLFRGRKEPLTTAKVTGVTGLTRDVEIAIIPELRIGPVILQDIPIAFADVPPFAVFGLSDEPALLLGTDLMESFRKVSLDFRARKVRFQLRKCDPATILVSTAPRNASRLLSDRAIPESCGG